MSMTIVHVNIWNYGSFNSINHAGKTVFDGCASSPKRYILCGLVCTLLDQNKR